MTRIDRRLTAHQPMDYFAPVDILMEQQIYRHIIHTDKQIAKFGLLCVCARARVCDILVDFRYRREIER